MSKYKERSYTIKPNFYSIGRWENGLWIQVEYIN